MTEEQRLLHQLLEEMDRLKKRQNDFEKEILALQQRIFELKARITPLSKPVTNPIPQQPIESPEKAIPASSSIPTAIPAAIASKPQKEPISWENFVGQKLISRVGIVITIIGIAIGVKYSIEHELLSPLYRMILGYVLAAGFFLLAVRLKKKYLAYSAVLISGSFATAYVVSFAAFSFYHFFPPTVAFILMLLITGATVAAANWYNQQVIAIIGLVGAYAIPFLVNTGSNNYTGFFSYISLINLGIVSLAFLRYWKVLLYSAFFASWVIFSSWYLLKAGSSENTIALIFLIIFFLSFYTAFLAYHLRRKELLPIENVSVILSNLLIFFSIGYHIIDQITTGQTWLFIFTISVAVLQALASWIVYRLRTVDRALLLLLGGLSLVLATVSIPVLLDGNWVTILWSGEALLLFIAALKFDRQAYARVAVTMLFLATFSLLQDWLNSYAFGTGNASTPFLNLGFFNTIFYLSVLGYINRYLWQHKPGEETASNRWKDIYRYLLPAMLIIFAYMGVAFEINFFWFDQLRHTDLAVSVYRTSIEYRTTFWIFIFSGIFVWLINFINRHFIKSDELSAVGITAFLLASLAFVLIVLSDLYKFDELYRVDGGISTADFLLYHGLLYAIAALLIFSSLQNDIGLKPSYGALSVIRFITIQILILSILSSELIFWFRQIRLMDAVAVAMSICWGLYAAGLIVWGLKKDRGYMRISGIVLLAITLLKLFFNDLSKVNTLAKTVIFLALGLLLLAVSFLYNRQLAKTAKLPVD